MSRNNRQMLSTILAVMAPLAHFSGEGYMAVLLAAGAMLPLTVLAGDGLNHVTKPEAAVELIWVGLVLGSLMPVSGANWPGEQAQIVVPLVILSLSVITGNKEIGERGSSTLFWVAAVLLALILGIMAGKAEPERLTPEPGIWSGGLIAALLYPSLKGAEKKRAVKTGIAVGALAVVLATVIQGVLGRWTGKQEISPLYEAGRCVGDGGFEILVSGALTLGWYGFAAMGMGASESFGEKLGLSEKNCRIAVGIIAVTMIISGVVVARWALIAGCLILWVLVPMLHPKK